jgi:hypothetical protein
VAFIDDFEEPAILPEWWSFSDIPGAPNPQMTIQPGGACGTAYSGHFAGTGAYTPTNFPETGYGAGALFNVAINPAIGQYCVDISAFDGISFWAKADGPIPSPNTNNLTNELTLQFLLPGTNAQACSNSAAPTNDTCPDGGLMSGGDCKEACYNNPRFAIVMSTVWRQYAVRFADATGGSASVQSLIQEIGWYVSSTSTTTESWGFSIDEITFYKNVPPTGPVAPPGGPVGAFDAQ